MLIAAQNIGITSVSVVLLTNSLVDNGTIDLDNSSKQESMHDLIARFVDLPRMAYRATKFRTFERL
jgi:hypothetical protein